MISTSLNHCKEMGAEPGRRSLKIPAEKLGPVIVVLYFIFLMELLFVVAKIIGSPSKNDSLLFHSKLF